MIGLLGVLSVARAVSLDQVMNYFSGLEAGVALDVPVAPLNATCDSNETLQWLGVAQFQLHAYNPFEALRALARAQDCAMTFVLLAHALGWNAGYAEAADEAAKRAMEWSGPLTERERIFVRLLGAAKRATQFDRLALQGLALWPDDVELSLLCIRKWTTRSMRSAGRPSELDRAQAHELLARLGEREAQLSLAHRLALAHYGVHAFDDTMTPERALPAAELLASSSVPHFRHMAGHVFFMVGLSERAAATLQASRDADELFMRRHGVDAFNNWNFVHNLAFTAVAHATAGKYDDAVRVAAEIGDLRLEEAARPEPLPFAAAASRSMSRWMFQGLPLEARVHAAFGNYSACADAATARLTRAAEVERLDATNAAFGAYVFFVRTYCHGMARVMANEIDGALTALSNATDALEELQRSDAPLLRQSGRGIDLLRVHFSELTAATTWLQGNHDESIELFERALALERALTFTEPPIVLRSLAYTFASLLLQRGTPADVERAATLAEAWIKMPPREAAAKRELAARVAEVRGKSEL